MMFTSILVAAVFSRTPLDEQKSFYTFPWTAIKAQDTRLAHIRHGDIFAGFEFSGSDLTAILSDSSLPQVKLRRLSEQGFVRLPILEIPNALGKVSKVRFAKCGDSYNSTNGAVPYYVFSLDYWKYREKVTVYKAVFRPGGGTTEAVWGFSTSYFDPSERRLGEERIGFNLSTGIGYAQRYFESGFPD